jgi:DNA-binding Xre family transcriptional regulator
VCMPPGPSDPASRPTALNRLKTALIEKKMTQAELADAADCHEKTIQNLMNGRSVRDQTLFDVCMVLGLDFDDIKRHWTGGIKEPFGMDSPGKAGEGGEIAPLYMGAYSRAAVDHYIGHYLTLRPSFSVADVIVAYRTEITWDRDWPSLLFQESNRPDAPYSHRGRLYIPASSMFIHLVSLTKGAMRMIVVSQLDQGGAMRGLITTLNKRGATLTPVSSPLVLLKVDESLSATDTYGEITVDHPRHAEYRRVLAESVTQGYARLVAS